MFFFFVDPFIIEWETGEQEDSYALIKNEDMDTELSLMESKPEIDLLPKDERASIVSTDITLPERLTVVDSTTMETITSIKLEPQEEAGDYGNNKDGYHDSNRISTDTQERLPDDLLVMKDYVGELGHM